MLNINFVQDFLTFTLDIPLALQQRESKEKESTMFFPNFLTFTLETPSLFQHRRIEDTDEKEDLTSTFSYQLCSRRRRELYRRSGNCRGVISWSTSGVGGVRVGVGGIRI